jgi:hypothetical protein
VEKIKTKVNRRVRRDRREEMGILSQSGIAKESMISNLRTCRGGLGFVLR